MVAVFTHGNGFITIASIRTLTSSHLLRGRYAYGKNMSNIPEGFEPIFRSSPYLQLLGPIYNKKTENGLVIGLRAQEKHCNAREQVHGGVFSSLADIALGYNAAFSGDSPVPIVTASLTIDYAGSAKLDDWIEIETDLQKVGRKMAFANCYFIVNTKRIARASGVFTVISA
jgi:acyl-coenzyme A thioesterase 13